MLIHHTKYKLCLLLASNFFAVSCYKGFAYTLTQRSLEKRFEIIINFIRYNTTICYNVSITRNRFRPCWFSSGWCERRTIIKMSTFDVCKMMRFFRTLLLLILVAKILSRLVYYLVNLFWNV